MLAGIFITLASLWYGQNNGLMPIAASAEAELVDGLFNAMMTISVGLFLLVQGALVIAAFRFRRRAGDDTDGQHIEGNVPLEILWTALPAVIVLGISVYSFDIYTQMGGLDTMGHDMASHKAKSVEVAYAPSENAMPLLVGSDASEDGEMAESGDNARLLAKAGLGVSPTALEQGAPLEVDVMAVQYAFVFTYKDTGVISGELRVPVDQSVKLNIQAQDVLHAFWLPEFRIKQDAIPGEPTELAFTASRVGTYPVVCAELCGPYHGAMKTQIVVQSQDDFEGWVQSQVALMMDAGETVAVQPEPTASDTGYLAALSQPLGLKVAPEALKQLHSETENHSALHTMHSMAAESNVSTSETKAF